MFDFTSILYALVVSFGIFGLDAAWNADTVTADFQVASSIEHSGVKPEFAAAIYTREIREIFNTESLVRSPAIRSSYDKSFVTILAESVGMKEATRAFQDLFQLEPVAIKASLTSNADQARLEIIGEASHAGAFYLAVDARPGEPPVALIRRAAVESAIRLDPYHAALFFLDPADARPDIPRAKQVIDEAIAVQAPTRQNVMRGRLRNLRGIVALMEHDKDAAAVLFEQAMADDPKLVPAHLNLAFTRVEQDRYNDAAMIARHLLQSRSLDPTLMASAHTILGVVAWSQRQIEAAEAQFAAAVAAAPLVSDAYFYWGHMLAEAGRVVDARQKIAKGEENLAAFENYPEVATLYFWMTEKDGVPLQPRPRGRSAAPIKPGKTG